LFKDQETYDRLRYFYFFFYIDYNGEVLKAKKIVRETNRKDLGIKELD